MLIQRKQAIDDFVIKHEPSTFDTPTNVGKIKKLHDIKFKNEDWREIKDLNL